MTDLTPRMTDRLIRAFVILGCVAALVRSGLCFPIWPDEAFLAISIARMDAAGILGPLEYHQVAPPLFLLLEEAATSTFGFNEWSLRLVPLIASIASLLLFPSLARRMLSGWAAVFAVGLFAVSYWLIRYSAESKPYSIDVLISVLMLLLAHRHVTRASIRSAIPLWIVCGLSFGLSFPAAFIGGGVAVTTAWNGLRSRRRVVLIAGVVAGICLLAGFLLTYTLHTRTVSSHEIDWMRGYWDRAFPPLPSISGTLLWFVGHITGELLPYPVGGRTGASTLTFIFCVIGAIAMVRTRRRDVVITLGIALTLAMIAAVLHRYPFGAPTRCQLYLAPIFCLLAGNGLAATLPNVAAARDRRAALVCFVLACIGLIVMMRDVLSPSKTRSDAIIRDVVREIWDTSDSTAPQTICFREDLGMTFTPDLDRKQTLLTSYLCNYHIHADPPHEYDIVPSNGIRVVNYRIGDITDETLRQMWIDRFERTNDVRLTSVAEYPCPDLGKRGEFRRLDLIEVLHFTPVDPD